MTLHITTISAVSIVFLAVGWIMQQLALGYRRMAYRKLAFPVLGSPDDADFTQAVTEGCRKYPDSPFIIPTKTPQVVLPMSLYAEHLTLPALSFDAFTHEMMMGRWTGLGGNVQEIKDAVRQDLTKNLGDILPLIQDETKYAFAKELGFSADWHPIPVYSTMVKMVALLSGRVFVGSPLHRDKEWLDASINYTIATSDVMESGNHWHPLLIPFVAPFLSGVSRAKAYEKKAQDWMAPMVEQVMKSPKDAGQVGSHGMGVAWFLRHVPQHLKTAKRLGRSQMLVTFAAIHTTSTTVSLVLFQLCTRPEYTKGLREEIIAVLAEDGEGKDDNGNSFIRKQTFAKLRKLDSFIRETLRWCSMGLNMVNRIATEDVVFSNGVKIPKGTHISFPTWVNGMSPSNLALSPEYNAGTNNKSPDEFDGFRFARLREIPGREVKHQSVTTGMDHVFFGHGPHACPGRFFAIYEVKALLVELLRYYDFRLYSEDSTTPLIISRGLGRHVNPMARLDVKRLETPIA